MINIRTKAIICGFVVSVFASFSGFAKKCDGISEKVLRMHIIANSDSAEDQNLKLKVRDRILRDFGSELKSADDLVSAKRITKNSLEKVCTLAQDEVIKSGYNYIVNASMVNMHFNTRHYGDITLPAGQYDAVRITIGEARGKNWWCVMFPPMCVPAAQSEEELSDVLAPCEMEIIVGGNSYQVTLKAFEIFMQVKDYVSVNVYEPLHRVFSQENTFEYRADFKVREIFTNLSKDISFI